MKKKSILLSLVALCVLALFSCSDKNDAPSYSSKALKNVELVNILKAKGYTFNENGQLALNDLVNNTTSLDLSGTKLKDLTELDIFPNLHELKLTDNGYGPTFDFTKLPAQITGVDLTNNDIYDFEGLVSTAVSTCKCTAHKVKEYFRKNTQKGYENLIFLSGDGLFFQQLC